MEFQELVQKQADLKAQLDALEPEDGSFASDEDEQKYEATIAEAEAINKQLLRQQRRMELERKEVKRDRGPVTTAGLWEGKPEEPEQLADFKGQDPLVYRGVETSDEAIRIKSAFGQQLIDAYKFKTTGQASENLLKLQAAAQGAGEAIGADGGFLVQTDVGGMLQRQIETGSEVLSRVRNVPVSANSNGISFLAVDETSRAGGSRWGGVQGFWVDEGTAITASKPTFRKVKLELNKLAALGYATSELLQDGVALGSIMFDAFAEELRFLVEDAIYAGTGVGQPLGILNAPATISVAKEGGQAADTLTHQNLVDMWVRVHSRSKGNSVVFINNDVNPQLDTMLFSGSLSDLQPRWVTYSADRGVSIKGRPVVEIEYAKTLGDQGDIFIADLSSYLYISKLLQTASSMHVAFTTDEQAFRVTWRVDGRPSWVSALTPANGTTTVSPFVTLDERA